MTKSTKRKRQPAEYTGTSDERFAAFVRANKRLPREILDRLDEAHCDLINHTLGVTGAAGRVAASVNGCVSSGERLPVDQVVYAMSLLEASLEGLRQAIGWTRDDILAEHFPVADTE